MKEIFHVFYGISSSEMHIFRFDRESATLRRIDVLYFHDEDEWNAFSMVVNGVEEWFDVHLLCEYEEDDGQNEVPVFEISIYKLYGTEDNLNSPYDEESQQLVITNII